MHHAALASVAWAYLAEHHVVDSCFLDLFFGVGLFSFDHDGWPEDHFVAIVLVHDFGIAFIVVFDLLVKLFDAGSVDEVKGSIGEECSSSVFVKRIW